MEISKFRLEYIDFTLEYIDFTLQADTIPALVDELFSNYKRIIGKLGRLSYWNGISYQQMKSADIRLFRKLYKIRFKKQQMENDFI